MKEGMVMLVRPGNELEMRLLQGDKKNGGEVWWTTCVRRECESGIPTAIEVALCDIWVECHYEMIIQSEGSQGGWKVKRSSRTRVSFVEKCYDEMAKLSLNVNTVTHGGLCELPVRLKRLELDEKLLDFEGVMYPVVVNCGHRSDPGRRKDAHEVGPHDVHVDRELYCVNMERVDVRPRKLQGRGQLVGSRMGRREQR